MNYNPRPLLVLSAVGLALCLAAPAEAAKEGKKKSSQSAHSGKHRGSAVAARQQNGSGVRRGPLYNGQDYIGDDPDPNIRSYLIRDMTRYGGQD